MLYVEFLRARQAFAIFAIVLAVGAIFTIGSIEYAKRTAAVNIVNAPAHDREVEREIERARREGRSHTFSRTIVRSDRVTEHFVVLRFR